MKTGDLIDQLANEGAAPSGPPLALRFAVAIFGGLLLAVVVLTVVLGMPFSAIADTGLPPFATKLGFTLSVALIAAAALFGAGRPGSEPQWRLAFLTLPFLILAALAATELANGKAAFPGRTWATCLASVSLLTPVVFVASIVGLRRMAPVRLRLAGGLAGLLAGGASGLAYALWCPETTALFLFSWYAVPILAAGGIGALLGPRLLRW